MEIPSSWVVCDGCGLPASPDHIAERLSRLELATRFRPIHITVLFVAAAPLARPEDDFYRPPESREFFNAFLEAVEIPVSGSETPDGMNQLEHSTAELAEFQRRGYYLSYLSECPISTEDTDVTAAISRLALTLIRRVRFNYKPKRIALLGNNLNPLLDVFEKAGMSSSTVQLIETPKAGDAASAARLRTALSNLAPHENLASGYDRI
jgi:hypothetical protein